MPGSDHPVPDLGTFMAADTPEGRPRLGKVTAWDGEFVHLQRPGGGVVWTAAPYELRRPSDDERALIRVLTTPVPAAAAADPPPRRFPEPPVVLSVDPAPPAVPTPGCVTCTVAAEHERHHRRTHDHSAAADFRVEIRNHPHDEPKLTLPRELP
ncbi:hypothetical protein [Streptomyces sp. NRRL F-5727]|uniref:hypothetical protein n=1 Tax=Streptomyces sp. NRRL F-5727 TaxID=1463871 RepID=UPI00131A9386|nr:hypothetical protein [Streptomyces sp. NRRL F-5727]